MTKFFYVKKQQKNVEDHYWLGANLSTPYPLTQAKIISELVGLAFYQMMGVKTPKTYVSEFDFGPVIMSQKIDSWEACKASSQYFNRQLEPLPLSIMGLAELELASAFLGDIDVVGWLDDNIGLQKDEIDNKSAVFVTKHDAGSAIVENEQFSHFKKYFKDVLSEFPEGTMTLAKNTDLKTTYLKVFMDPSITKYNEHYKNIFSNITPEMRSHALRRLFLIATDDIKLMVDKIGDELRLPQEKRLEIISFMSNRLALFKTQFTPALDAINKSNVSLPLRCFKGLIDQKHISRHQQYLVTRLDIQPPSENDYSQSSARYFKKLPKSNAEPLNIDETQSYFKKN